jgi:hypothetical protein
MDAAKTGCKATGRAAGHGLLGWLVVAGKGTVMIVVVKERGL